MQDTKQPKPQGKYVTANRHGEWIITAGMTPRDNGKLVMTGKIDSSLPLEHYKEVVRLSAGNALKAAKGVLTEGERILKVVSMTVYVNAHPDFTLHTQLADFASDYLCEELGEDGVVSRAAVGVASLPSDAPVEIQLFVIATK